MQNLLRREDSVKGGENKIHTLFFDEFVVLTMFLFFQFLPFEGDVAVVGKWVGIVEW